MSQLSSMPDAEPLRVPAATEKGGALKRYFVVTLMFALWCDAWMFLDAMFDFWILVVLIIFPPFAIIAIYLIISLIVSIVKQDLRRFLSVLLGPVAAVVVNFFAVAIAGSLGLTPDHLLFLKHRSEILAFAADSKNEQMLVVGTLRMSGFFWACTSTTLVVRGPDRQIDMTPTQRAAEWKRSLAQVAGSSHCGGSSVRVSHLEGDLYAVRLE